MDRRQHRFQCLFDQPPFHHVYAYDEEDGRYKHDPNETKQKAYLNLP
jgi:hypothetical protein